MWAQLPRENELGRIELAFEQFGWVGWSLCVVVRVLGSWVKLLPTSYIGQLPSYWSGVSRRTSVTGCEVSFSPRV